MLSKVQELERTLDNDLKKINDSASRRTLEKLNGIARESFQTMHQLLSVDEEHLEVAKEQVKLTRYIVPPILVARPSQPNT